MKTTVSLAALRRRDERCEPDYVCDECGLNVYDPTPLVTNDERDALAEVAEAAIELARNMARERVPPEFRDQYMRLLEALRWVQP